MMSINKKELVDLTSSILTNIERPIPPTALIDNINFIFINRDGYSFMLKGDTIAEFDKFVHLVSKDPNFKDVSIKTIENEFLDLIICLKETSDLNKEKITSQIDSYLSKLGGLVEEFRVIVALDNLKLEGMDEIKIGNIRIVPFSSIENKIKEYINKTIDLNLYYNKDQKDILKKESFEKIQNFSGKVCADIIVNAEGEASFIKALREVDSVINLLRCYIPLLFSRGMDITLGLSGAIIKGHRIVASFKEGGGFTFHRSRIGPPDNYILDKEKMKILEENYHLKEISEMLAKDISSRSKIEKRICTAARWIGTGMVEEEDCDKFLKFSVALECLLTGQKEEISTHLAERCAFILHEEHINRLDSFKKVKRLYNIRSEIAHQGKMEIESDHLNEIKWISIICLMNICNNIKKYHWQDFEDLANWVQERKFGLP
jgi:hypothetical protein